MSAQKMKPVKKSQETSTVLTIEQEIEAVKRLDDQELFASWQSCVADGLRSLQGECIRLVEIDERGLPQPKEARGRLKWARLVVAQTLRLEVLHRYRGYPDLLGKLAKMPVAEQDKALRPIAYLDFDGVEREAMIEEIGDRALLIAADRIRSIDEQRAWLRDHRSADPLEPAPEEATVTPKSEIETISERMAQLAAERATLKAELEARMAAIDREMGEMRRRLHELTQAATG